MAILSAFVLFVLLLCHGSDTSAENQVGAEDSAGSTADEVAGYMPLSGASLTYGQLQEYLTNQDKLLKEKQGLKNDTQSCCEEQWTVWNTAQQQSFASLQSTVLTIIQQQQITINQLHTLLADLTDRLNGPRDCMEVLAMGQNSSGVYTIYPDGGGKSPVHVYCDMDTDGGGWTLFQKRQDGSINFYRDWHAYKTGFGDLRGEFWIGNDILHRLTAQGRYQLRVDLEDFEGNTAYAKYNIFRVETEINKYRLTVDGYSGTAGDAMADHNGRYFTTKDRDNDESDANCAVSYRGAWWYDSCHHSNLNGLYLGGPHEMHAVGVNWLGFGGHQYSLKTTEMKIRPN